MLKETKTEKTIVFCDIFIFGSISIGGERGPGTLPPSRYAYVVQAVQTEKHYSKAIQSHNKESRGFGQTILSS